MTFPSIVLLCCCAVVFLGRYNSLFIFLVLLGKLQGFLSSVHCVFDKVSYFTNALARICIVILFFILLTITIPLLVSMYLWVD
jgi:hypothetical protein